MNTEGYTPRNVYAMRTTERPVYSFAWLCDSMRDRNIVRLLDSCGNVRCGVIVGITPESGGGKDWLVKMNENNAVYTHYVKAT